jgi:Icc-related predicted phosphoesterase
MKVALIGDVHGLPEFSPQLMSGGSIQVGDCSLNYNQWVGKATNKKVFFIDGNHDNFDILNPDAREPYSVINNLYHIPRGYVSGKVLFIGGAESIDKSMRTPGIDWWPQESISQLQYHRIMDLNVPIEVIISHDCPLNARTELGLPNDGRSPSALALSAIYSRFKPKLWVFGHHHRTITNTIGECTFNGLGIAFKVRMDLPLGKNWGE